jgi:uncharacterized protein
MRNDIWLNLPVKDLEKSIKFFTHLGFKINPGPGNSVQSASFLVGDNKVVLMLFAQELFVSFTRHALVDTSTGSEVLFSLGASSRKEVDDYAQHAGQAGGIVFAEPGESNGFMYGCGFCDLDGHRWNALYMDMSKLPQ